MKEDLRQGATDPTRRDFLKGIAAFGGIAAFESMVIPPALAQSLEKSAVRRFSMREGNGYDMSVVDRILRGTSNKARDLTEEEFQNIGSFAQRLYSDISGGDTIQSELKRNFPQFNEHIELVVSEGKSFVDSGTARFGHVPRSEGMSRLYVSADREARGLPLTFLHELTHGAYGVGEVRAQSMTVLGGLHAIASRRVSDIEALADSEDLFSLWSQEFRHRFYASRMRDIESMKINPQDLRYRYLPILLYTVLRSIRMSGKPLNQFQIIKGAGRDFELRLADGFVDLLKAGKDPLVSIEAMMLGYISECADLIRSFNPKSPLPVALQKHEARSR